MGFKVSLFGTTPNDWKVSKLGDIAELRQGLQISKKLRKDTNEDGSIPLLKISDLPDRTFSEFVKDIPQGYVATKEDIIYTRTGQVGLVFTDIVGCVHNNCFKVIVDYKRFDKYFFYYYLNSPQVRKYANAVAGGSVQKDLTHKAFKNCIIAYPVLKEQNGISKILLSLDEKIQTNNQINKRLEEMAQSIYKRWFVDFEFPNEDGLPYKSSGGEMVKSKLGMIPKGWEVGSATEQFNVQSGGTPKTNVPEYWNGEIPFFTPKDSHISSIFVIDTEKNITTEGLSKCNSKLYDEGTIFITARGTVGNVAMAGRKMAMNQSCYALIPNEGFNYNYIYFLLIQLVNTLKANASGSVFDAIIVSTFTSLKTVIPSKEIVDQFNGIVQSLFSQVLNNTNENKRLGTIRDTLLPKLMSGEIRVPIES